MNGPIILWTKHGFTYVPEMNRPDPPESDTVVRTSDRGDRQVFEFAGYEDGVPVYRDAL